MAIVFVRNVLLDWTRTTPLRLASFHVKANDVISEFYEDETISRRSFYKTIWTVVLSIRWPICVAIFGQESIDSSLNRSVASCLHGSNTRFVVSILFAGSPCACLYERDDGGDGSEKKERWYRGVFERYVDDELRVVRVQLVDDGRVVDVSPTRVKQLPTEFLAVKMSPHLPQGCIT